MYPYEDLPCADKTVLVIGAAGLDIVGRTVEMPEPKTSIPAKVRPSFGGVSRNVAENLAHLGMDVQLITAVGQDQFGWQLLEHANSAGVGIDFCIATDKRSTASYLAVLDETGDLNFAMYDMRVLESITPQYIKQHADLFAEAGLVFCGCKPGRENPQSDFFPGPQSKNTRLGRCRIAQSRPAIAPLPRPDLFAQRQRA